MTAQLIDLEFRRACRELEQATLAVQLINERMKAREQARREKIEAKLDKMEADTWRERGAGEVRFGDAS